MRSAVALLFALIAVCSCQLCEQNSLRLVGGNRNIEGRVEICRSGQWGTVCDDFWNNADARVVCAQLGFRREGAQAFSGARFGQGVGGRETIFLDNVMCSGTEERLVDCPHLTNHNCGHNEDAGVRCLPSLCSDGDVRLVGGGSSAERQGRVEVCLDSVWGTVCDDEWDNVDAGTVCTQLGFARQGAQAFSEAHFGQGVGVILLDDVRCTGSESRLIDCLYDSDTGDCSHLEDAGVRCELLCTRGDIRLVGGSTSREGRVEVCINQEWGTVCDDRWGTQDSQVVCQQLGYSREGSQVRTRAAFGRGTGLIALDDVECSGSESRLIDCPYDPHTSDCNHGEDAGVVCQPIQLCTEGAIRLMDGATDMEGRVEVCVGRRWGTVCDDAWSVEDARVACGQLGFSRLNADHSFRPRAGSGPIHLDNVACTGTEMSLVACHHDSHTADCNHGEDAGVRCQPICNQGDVRIGEGRRVSDSEGRVEVCLNNAWGTVCDDRWDTTDAGVVCQQLGFSRHNAIAIERYGGSSGQVPIHMDELGCQGTELRLLDCPHTTSHDCSHSEDAGVRCNTTLVCQNGELRLVGGADSTEGRVELCWNETWGSVCDRGWSQTDANVACGQLGYATREALAFPSARYGQGSGPIYLSNVACLGSETGLINCTHSGIGAVGSCNHGNDASVRCVRRVCFNWDMRLVGGQTQYEGRVEICWQDQWGTVCDDLWDRNDARVVCNHLGYNQTISSQNFLLATFGRGSGPIWLDNVNCVGTEGSLRDCPARPLGVHNCGHNEDAGVRCSQCVEQSVRLVGGATDYEGRVEVCLGGGWGTVCDDGWSIADAAVVCRQLGLPTQNAQTRSNAFFGRGVGLPILMDNVQCGSTETQLASCSYLNTHNLRSCAADHSEDAGVVCGIPPPGQPQHLIISSITASSAVISWQHPLSSSHFTTVHHYTLNCTTQSPYLHQSFVTEDNSTLSVRVNRLHPYTTYTCCVRAVGMGGEGEASCQSRRTLETAPTGSPVNLQGHPISSVSLALSWSPPPSELINGILRRYHVNLTVLETGETQTYIVTNPMVGISALHPYYRYRCSVAAVTIAPGPPSATVTIRTFQDVPSAPPRTISAVAESPTSVRLSWSPPLPRHRNGIITGYSISLTVASNGHRRQYTTSQQSSYVVPGLQAYTRYIATMAASTVNGTGPQSIGYEVMTAEAAPSRPPRNLIATVTSSSTLELAWTTPRREFWNGMIRYHTIEMTEFETGTVQMFNTSNSFLSVGGLHPNYQYRFRVASVTMETGPFANTPLVQLWEDAPSGPPTNIHIALTTDPVSPSATISWNPPPIHQRNGEITGYIVTLTNINIRLTSSHNTGSMSFNLNNLVPNTEYSVTVSARTSAGTGPASQINRFSTDPGVPTGPPRNFQVISPITSTSLTFSWNPPPSSQQNGVIIGYSLRLVETQSGIIHSHNIVSSTFFTARELRPFYNYMSAVAAYTEAGVGPYTENITQRTLEDAPSGYPLSLITNIISAREVQLSWGLPRSNQTNGIISGYIVTVTGIQSGESYRNETTTTRLSVTTLPYTSYMFTVAARTVVGQGPFSPEVVVETPEDVPSDHPQSLSVDIISSTSFRLSWAPPPPQYHHGNIQQYKIRVGQSGTETEFNSSTTEIVVTGLLPYTMYSYRVAAVTVGEGPFTTEMFVRTAEDAPSESPRNVRVTFRSSTVIRVQWSPPLSQNLNGVLRNFHVRLSSSSTHNDVTTSTSFEFTDLIPNTRYRVQVAANTVSLGPYSNRLRTTTLEDVPGSPPTNVIATKNSPTSVSLNWSPPLVSNGVIARYHANLVECDTDTLTAVQVTSESAEFNGLHPYYTYKYSVAAATTIGRGPYSNNGTVQLDEAAPSNPPSNLVVVSTTSTTATISWAPPPLVTQNGIIRSYIITLQAISRVSSDAERTIVSHTESYTLTALQPGSRYQVGVAAVTVETGPQSSYVEFNTSEEVPGSPTNLNIINRSSRSMSLSWSPPLPQHRNGAITSYSLNVTQVSPPTDDQPMTFKTSLLEYTVSSLHPAYVYEVGVAAETSAGLGPAIIVSVTLQEDAPTAPPVDVITTSPTPSSLMLSWRPPPVDQQNGVITEYWITIIELDTQIVHTATTSSTSHAQTGLRPFYEYELFVAAFTVALGPNITMRVRQPEDVPGSPGELTVNHTSSTTALLCWSPVPVQSQHGIITGYSILVTSSDINQPLTFSVGPNTLEHQVSNLRPLTVYNFSVAAETSAGRGTPLVITSSTPQEAPTVVPSNVMATRISATAIEVTWDTLPEGNDLSAQISFLVRYRVVNGVRARRNIDDTAMVVEVEESGHVIRGLEPHLLYGVSVAIKNEVGVGEYSNEIVAELYKTSPFRVHLYGPIVCLPWTSTGISEKTLDIVNFLMSSIQQECDCTFSPKYIAQSTLHCGDQSTDRTILHASFVTSDNISSTSLREHLQELVYKEPTVIVQGVQLQIAPCTVLPLEEGGGECPIYPTVPVVQVPLESEGVSIPMIAGIAGGGLLLLICATVALILIVIVMKKRQVKKEKKIARRTQDLRLNLTLTTEDTINGALNSKKDKDLELTKEQEATLYDVDHIYDEIPSKFSPNFVKPLPLKNSMATFGQKTSTSDSNVIPSTRGRLPDPPTMIPTNAAAHGYKNVAKSDATFEGEYTDLDGLGPEAAGPEYSQLDVKDMPQLRYGNIGTSDVIPNEYEYASTMLNATPTSTKSEYLEPYTHTSTQSTTPSNPYQPLILNSKSKDSPQNTQYQELGPPVGYDVPQVSRQIAMTTKSDVPQPSLRGGWRGKEGKPPILQPAQQGEVADDYIEMASPTL